jgi:glycogen synthase
LTSIATPTTASGSQYYAINFIGGNAGTPANQATGQLFISIANISGTIVTSIRLLHCGVSTISSIQFGTSSLTVEPGGLIDLYMTTPLWGFLYYANFGKNMLQAAGNLTQVFSSPPTNWTPILPTALATA